MVAVLLLFLQSAGDPTPVYDGRLHRIEVRVPRIDAPSVHIDGVLDEAAWQQAALLTGFTLLQVRLSMTTVIIAHVAFTVSYVAVVVRARLAGLDRSLEEAAADLGAPPFRAFRDITFPQMRSALIAGALLAFGLSFDEIVVTTFTAGQQQTLPIWILSNLSRPNNLPVVNVVALFVILLSIVPVYVAQRLTADPVGLAPGGARAV